MLIFIKMTFLECNKCMFVECFIENSVFIKFSFHKITNKYVSLHFTSKFFNVTRIEKMKLIHVFIIIFCNLLLI